MNVTYIGAVTNASGYSDAARNYVMALTEVGVNVEVVPVSFEKFSSNLGRVGERIKSLVSNNPQARIQIIHTVPSVFDSFTRPDKYNIGYTVWETSRLPKKWVDHINAMDEVWVPTVYNHEVFKSSGVKVPIFIIPHAFNRQSFDEEVVSINMPHISPDDYIFYSIFQWTARKNPVALLKAYLTEFNGLDKVCLILKTYLFDPTNNAEKEKLKSTIASIKDKLRMPDFPKIILISDLLAKGQVHGLHKMGHCYLSTHASEGWGIPQTEAMMAGNPVICTGYSGTADFITEATGFPVKYQLTPVYDMCWEAYSGNQTWADIDIMDMREKMRYVFEHRREAKKIGLNGQDFVTQNLSWSIVGNMMKKRLGEIESKL